MDKREELIKIFSKDIRVILKQVMVDFDQVQEIRLRVHAPLLMICNNREYYITPEGNLSMKAEEAYLVTREALKETLDYIAAIPYTHLRRRSGRALSRSRVGTALALQERPSPMDMASGA